MSGSIYQCRTVSKSKGGHGISEATAPRLALWKCVTCNRIGNKPFLAVAAGGSRL